jgi:hypothetical protein
MGAMASVHQTAIAAAICRSLPLARRFEEPYRHFYAGDLLPRALVETLALLPLEPQDAAHFAGKREEENAKRFYIDAPLMRRFPPLAGLAEALQSGQVAAEISTLCGADLDGAHLRLEYALDRDGFWLEPHTDLGEKKLTCLISLADGEAQADLGTDIYGPDKSLSKRAVPPQRRAHLRSRFGNLARVRATAHHRPAALAHSQLCRAAMARPRTTGLSGSPGPA